MAGPFVAHLFRGLSGVTIPSFATGWTETWYPKASDITTAGTMADQINSATASVYPSFVKTGPIKVSDLTVKGDVFYPTVTTPTGQYMATPGPSPATGDPNLALRFYLYGADPKFRSIHYFRGLPVTLLSITVPYTVTPDTVLATALAQIFTVVSTDAQLVHRVPGFPPTYTVNPINSARYPGVGKASILSNRRSGRPFDLRRGRRGV